jgi:hypothetical protein
MKSNNLLILLAVVGVIVYGGVNGWFNFNFNFNNQIVSPETLQELEKPVKPGCSITLSLTPTTLTSGDVITGTLQNGANAYCEAFGKMIGTSDWRKIWEGRTNINGMVTYSDSLLVAGNFVFAVMCDTNGNGILDAQDCVSNEVSVNVNVGPEDTPCSDSDGKNKMTPGFVKKGSDYFYDNCAGNWAVTEFFCNGNTKVEQVIGCDAGYICFETRGGDYCKLATDIPTPPQYHCCYAMGVKSCYEGGCPPAGLQLGVYDSLNECQISCDSSASGEYTCGNSRWCASGTCPRGYSCNEINNLAMAYCGCVSDGDFNLVHPDWRIGGSFYNRIIR